jgi:hypothetical protein
VSATHVRDLTRRDNLPAPVNPPVQVAPPPTPAPGAGARDPVQSGS